MSRCLSTRWSVLPFALLAASSLAWSTPPSSNPPLPHLSLIQAMTPDEKASLLNGVGMDLVANIGSIQGRVPGAGGETKAIDRLNIPSIIVADGPAGLRISSHREGEDRTYYTTAFPATTSLASSWNSDLLYRVGSAMGVESKEYGVDVLLAPGINIQRNPLNGRNFEYMSEDPYLSGMLAASFIDGVQVHGVGTSLKHFAANNAETNRLYSNSLVSERAMREIYLRGFEIAVKKAQPWTIMTAYNKINHQYANARYDLNTEILRNEWGYNGVVMTDWYAGYANGGEMLDPNHSSDVIGEIESGNDLLMPGDKKQIKALENAIIANEIDSNAVDQSLSRILDLIYKSPSAANYRYSDNPNLKEHAALSREAAAEGMVLLKNWDDLLPLNFHHHKIALFNADSYWLIAGGTGSSDLEKAYLVTIDEGLENNGALIDQSLKAHYKPYVKDFWKEELERRKTLDFQVDKLPLYRNIPFREISDQMIRISANHNDVAIVTLARNAGETQDQVVEGDFYFNDEEIDLLKRVSTIYRNVGKPVIVLLNVPSAVDVSRWDQYADAILVTWFPGQEGGNSIADLLNGTVTPSAKLTQTFPKKYEDLPSAESFYGIPRTNPTDILYREGIYVGYRYFDTFDLAPAYPFGFGLSYTLFNYDALKIYHHRDRNELGITVNITNQGKYAGAEVVQLYVSAPEGEIDKPKQELKAFAKTAVLEPGQSETIVMKLTPHSLASYSPEEEAWIADRGEYQIIIGSSSADPKLHHTITLDEKIIVDKVTPTFTESLPFTDLLPPKWEAKAAEKAVEK